MSGDSSHAGIDDLRRVAGEVEDAVVKDNIYKEEVFDNLLRLENVMNGVRSELGLENRDLLKMAGVRDPLAILNSAMDYWDGKISPGKQEKEGKLESDKELTRILENDFKIRVGKSKAVFVPPEEQSVEMGPGGGDEAERNKIDYNRVALALSTLLHLNINGERIMLDDIGVTVSSTPKGSFRERPYWEINVGKYRISVLVSNQYGNRTFVTGYKSENARKKMLVAAKSELKVMPGVKHFKFENPEQFVRDLTEAFETIIGQRESVPMDLAYFSDAEKIRADLTGFAAKVGVSIKGLSVRNIAGEEVECANGEFIKGQRYLRRAAFSFGLADNIEKAASHQSAALKRLKETVGIKAIFAPMDKEYFNDEAKVFADLRVMAEATGRSIEDLSTSTDILRKKYIYSTGEEMYGHRYLSHAAVVLELADGSIEAGKTHASTLKFLKEKAGAKIEEFKEMDAEYFADREKVARDLQAYADSLGVPIEELNTSNMSSEEVVCANGESVKGQAYLGKGAFAMSFSDKLKKGRSFQKKTLNRLKELIGLELVKPMDAKYFRLNLGTDLRGYAVALGRELESLTAYSMEEKRITCGNGEYVRGETYIARAAVALGLAKDSRAVQKDLPNILEKLKEKVV